MIVNGKDLDSFLPGTMFNVKNGSWVGEIIENEKVGKAVAMRPTETSPKIDEFPDIKPASSFSELDIEFCQYNEIRQTLANISRDDTAEKMSEMLMDPNWSSYKMFEELAASYLHNGSSIRRGIDIATSILTGHTVPEIANQILEEHGLKDIEHDDEIEK